MTSIINPQTKAKINGPGTLKLPEDNGISAGLSGIQIGAAAGSMVFGAWGAYKAARYEKRRYKIQAQMQELQARRYDTAADDAKREGNRQVAMISHNAEQRVATTRVAQGAHGVAVAGSGTAAEVIASQRIAAEMQINQTLANAVAESWGYRRQAVDARNQALASRASASMVSPWAAAVNAGLKGAISLADSLGGSELLNKKKEDDKGLNKKDDDMTAYMGGFYVDSLPEKK